MHNSNSKKAEVSPLNEEEENFFVVVGNLRPFFFLFLQSGHQTYFSRGKKKKWLLVLIGNWYLWYFRPIQQLHVRRWLMALLTPLIAVCLVLFNIDRWERNNLLYFQVNTVYRWNAWNAFLNNIRNQNFVFLKPTEHTRKSAAVSRSGLQISFRSWVINYALGAGVTNFDYLLNALSRLNQDMLNAILFFLLKENSRDQSRNFSSSMNFICFSYRDWWSLLNVFQFPAHSLLTV